MLMPDVNLLIYAHRTDSPFHGTVAAWLSNVLGSGEPLALADVILTGFYRVITGRTTMGEPTPPDLALQQTNALRTHPAVQLVAPSEMQWEVFSQLCRDSGARGNLVTDAYIASLAITNDCDLATHDRDFRRFPGLRTIDPLSA